MDTDSVAASILAISGPVAAVVRLGTLAVIAALEGRRWMGLIGLIGGVAGQVVVFEAFGVDPSREFMEALLSRVPNISVISALYGGPILPVCGAAASGSQDRGGTGVVGRSPPDG